MSPPNVENSNETQPTDPDHRVRRHGAALETALLDAAWDELASARYAAFTIDGVATRARTGRAVIYRRWPNRAELAVAAIRHHASHVASNQFDTGTLRGSVLALLRELSTRVTEATAVVSFTVTDGCHEVELAPADLRDQTLAGATDAMQAIVRRAVERGEVDPSRLTPRIVALPVDLLRHELLMNQVPPSERTLTEIIDRIFLPLVLDDSYLQFLRGNPRAAERAQAPIAQTTTHDDADPVAVDFQTRTRSEQLSADHAR